MSKETIKKLIETIENIPPLPEISTAIMAELRKQEVSILAVSELIEKDISLATQILKVANSPAYGAINEVSTIHHAIMMLGFEEVKSILMAMAIQEFFTTDNQNKKIRKRFWAHSRICSYTTLMLAQHYKEKDCNTFFLSGLIHDIGKLIIDQYLHDEFQEIIEYIIENNCSYRDAEKKILGMAHGQIAAHLLHHWNFPKQVIMQVGRHHTPWKEIEFSKGAHILFLADALTQMAGYNCLEEEPHMTIEGFSKSAAMHIINKNIFELNTDLLEKFLIEINQFANEDS